MRIQRNIKHFLSLSLSLAWFAWLCMVFCFLDFFYVLYNIYTYIIVYIYIFAECIFRCIYLYTYIIETHRQIVLELFSSMIFFGGTAGHIEYRSCSCHLGRCPRWRATLCRHRQHRLAQWYLIPNKDMENLEVTYQSPLIIVKKEVRISKLAQNGGTSIEILGGEKSWV